MIYNFLQNALSDIFPCSSANNQLPCTILTINFTIRLADYEGKINYNWPNGTKNAPKL